MNRAPLSKEEQRLRNAVRQHLLRERAVIPFGLRVSLWMGVGLVLLYIGLLGVLAVVEPQSAFDMIRLLGLTLLGGREPALYAVYHTPTPLPFHWALLSGIIDDLSTLYLAVPLVWLAVERLRNVPRADAFVRSLQKTTYAHRHTIDRWGLAGLVLLLLMPGLGTGPTAAGGIGVLVGIPPFRLLVALSAANVAVNTFWAYVMRTASEATPLGGPWEHAHWVAIALVLGFAVRGASRRYRDRFSMVFPRPTTRDPAAWGKLRSKGFAELDHLVSIDVRKAAPLMGLKLDNLSRLYWAAEMMLVPSMTATWAGRLARFGVRGMHDLEALPRPVLVEVLTGFAGNPWATAWLLHDEATEYLETNPHLAGP